MSNNEQLAAEPLEANELMGRCRTAAGSVVKPEELLDMVMELLAREVLTAKLQGKPISENLPIVDRLMRYEAQRQRRMALRLRERKTESTAAASSVKQTDNGLKQPSGKTEPHRARVGDLPSAGSGHGNV